MIRTRQGLGLGPKSRSEIVPPARRHLRIVDAPNADGRPKTRGDCASGERPCVWVACSHNLYLDVNETTGTVKLNWPHLEPDEVDPKLSCALDVADRGGITLEDAGVAMNVTRARVGQIEEKAIRQMRRTPGALLDFDNPYAEHEQVVMLDRRKAKPIAPSSELADELNALLEGDRPTEDRSLVSDLLFFDEAPDTDERLCASVWSMFTRASNSNGFACKSRWSIQASKALRARMGEK